MLSSSKLPIKSQAKSCRSSSFCAMFGLRCYAWPRPLLDPDACRLIALCTSHCDGNGPSAPISLSSFQQLTLRETSEGFFFFLNHLRITTVLGANKVYTLRLQSDTAPLAHLPLSCSLSASHLHIWLGPPKTDGTRGNHEMLSAFITHIIWQWLATGGCSQERRRAGVFQCLGVRRVYLPSEGSALDWLTLHPDRRWRILMLCVTTAVSLLSLLSLRKKRKPWT